MLRKKKKKDEPMNLLKTFNPHTTLEFRPQLIIKRICDKEKKNTGALLSIIKIERIRQEKSSINDIL